MGVSLNYEFLFVGRDEESFLENYAYDINEEDEGRKGHLFVSVEVQNNPADAEKIGDIIFDTTRQVFFEESSSEDSYDRFEDALKEVNKRLKKLKTEKVSGYIGNLNVLITVLHNGILHLTQCGDAEAYLVRRRFVSSISDGLSEGGDSDETFSNIASGTVESGDVIVFSSTRLLRYMTKNDLARSASSRDAVAILDDLKDLISTEILGKVGLASIVFTQSDDNVVTSDVPTLDDNDDPLKQPLLQEPSHTTHKSRFSMPYFKSLKSLLSLGGGLFSWVKGFKHEGMTKQRILVILIAVILLLTLGIWYAKQKGVEREFILSLDNTLSEVQEDIDTARTQGQYDKEAAGITLSRAEERAREVLDSPYRAKANLLLQKIEDTKDILDNVTRVSTPKVFVDLSTKRENVAALGLLPGDKDGHLFVFEADGLYELILNEVQDPLTLDDTEIVIAGTYFDDRKSLLFLTKSGKLLEYKDGSINFMDTQDEAFHKAVAVDDWGNRVYLLDSDNNQLWRYSYSGARDKFSIGEAYNKDGDLKNAVDLTIDGSIFAIEPNGNIEKIFTGNHQDLVVKKQPFSTPSTASKIWTDDETSRLFVLDGAASKVYVYLKDKDLTKNELVYSNQYLFDTLGELRDFYVSKEDNKMYVLDATKVYEVPL